MKHGEVFIDGKWEKTQVWESPLKLFFRWFFQRVFIWLVCIFVVFGCAFTESIVNIILGG